MDPIEVEGHASAIYDGGREIGIMNTTEVATGAIAQSASVKTLLGDLTSWLQTARSAGNRGGLLDRSAYQMPNDPYNQMKQARIAVRTDDIVGAVADATEALAFEGGLKWEASDTDDADLFNQLSAEWNLDAKIREMWRETFTYDQVVVGKLWGWHDIKVRGVTDSKNRRKATRRIWAPQRLTVLDSLKTVPIGDGPLRLDELAWNAGTSGMQGYRDSDFSTDPLLTQFFSREYIPGTEEQARLATWGVVQPSLLQMNPEWVFRHCNTRPDYEYFPDVRLRSVFPLLDLKRNLMNSDRATLIGSANYILLIRKGSEKQPATNEEIANLRENYNFLAKVPVIVADHRLTIDIVAPKQDFVLTAEKYDTLDHRILARALSTFISHSTGASRGGSQAFDEMLAKVVNSRRHMIKRTLERELARAVVNHPRNAGIFKSMPSLVFTRRNVRVGTDQNYMATLWSMRQARETSRDTILEYMGLDEATEAQRLQVEDKLYDEIFQTVSSITGAPVNDTGGSGSGNSGDNSGGGAEDNSGTPEAPANSGRRGGRPVGGRKPTTPQRPGKNGGISENGNPSRGE
jgi:hypothetical protein